MPKVEPPTKTEQVKTAVLTVRKTVSRERDLAIAIGFLVIGFMMGRL
jgi:hypothetical protein